MRERKKTGFCNVLHPECNAGSGVSLKKKKNSEQFETLKLKPQALERSTITTDLQTSKKVGVSSR